MIFNMSKQYQRHTNHKKKKKMKKKLQNEKQKIQSDIVQQWHNSQHHGYQVK